MSAHRLMRRPDTGTIVKVYAWLSTRGFWEYYLLDPLEKKDYHTAIVMGHETEMGDVSLDEIRPFINAVAVGADLQDLAPCEGWEWV